MAKDVIQHHWSQESDWEGRNCILSIRSTTTPAVASAQDDGGGLVHIRLQLCMQRLFSSPEDVARHLSTEVEFESSAHRSIRVSDAADVVNITISSMFPDLFGNDDDERDSLLEEFLLSEMAKFVLHVATEAKGLGCPVVVEMDADADVLTEHHDDDDDEEDGNGEPCVMFERLDGSGGGYHDHHDRCSVCLSKMGRPGDCIATAPCTHVFHADCLFAWLDKSNTCPLCRSKMTSGGGDSA